MPKILPDEKNLQKFILVKGIVTDKSPGTKQFAHTACFPNCVPAMSDADMSTWMQYVYMQHVLWEERLTEEENYVG